MTQPASKMSPQKESAFYLVSESPRRKELLERLGIHPLIRAVNIKEFHNPDLSPEELTLLLAYKKMAAFCEKRTDVKSLTALSADTIVHIDGHHLGKPEDRNDAEKMLRLLSGKQHSVSTAFVLLHGGKEHKEVVSTDVCFLTLSERDIAFYLNTNEWIDAAGAYKIQERGEILINWINGSWSNVMGLPISRIYAILRDINYRAIL